MTKRNNERWLPAIGYEGSYDVSDQGRVFSRKTNKVLSAGEHAFGYKRVVLRKDGRSISVAVHRLVAQAFVAGAGDVVRHANHDPRDNRASNLCWGSHRDNVMDAVKAKRHQYGVKHFNARLTPKDVRAIRNDTRPVLEIAAAFGISETYAYQVRARKSWKGVR